MNLDRIEKIAEAVLYEGYMLYPYRASAVKNQQRWNFGVLCPRSYSEQQKGLEAWEMQTECLLHADASVRLGVKLRFLQIVNRSLGHLARRLEELPPAGEPTLETVQELDVGGRGYLPWQEAKEREVAVSPAVQSWPAPDRILPGQTYGFHFPAGRELESLRDEKGWIAGVIVREWSAVSGDVEVTPKTVRDGVLKVTVRVRNLTPGESSPEKSRAEALMDSLVSTHIILTAENGRFLSLLDPPEELRALAAECSNTGAWPVLVGEEGDRDAMLCSPIILYDYPQIAPESPGSLFDGTEIDEILSLRILTLTEEEKQQMRQSDQRAQQMLERTENMPPEQFMKLHGVLRGLRPVGQDALVNGAPRRGSR